MSDLVHNAESQQLSDALEKLGEEAVRLQTVIDTVPSFLWTSLPDGSKEYLNKRWYEYTGLPLEEGKGWGWKVVVHPDDLDRLIREWLALVEARKPGGLENRIRRYDCLSASLIDQQAIPIKWRKVFNGQRREEIQHL